MLISESKRDSFGVLLNFNLLELNTTLVASARSLTLLNNKTRS